MKYPLKNTDGDDKPDFLDITSNGSDPDLYQIGKANLDTLGGGFISIINDKEKDGIQAVVDTDLIKEDLRIPHFHLLCFIIEKMHPVRQKLPPQKLSMQ